LETTGAAPAAVLALRRGLQRVRRLQPDDRRVHAVAGRRPGSVVVGVCLAFGMGAGAWCAADALPPRAVHRLAGARRCSPVLGGLSDQQLWKHRGCNRARNTRGAFSHSRRQGSRGRCLVLRRRSQTGSPSRPQMLEAPTPTPSSFTRFELRWGEGSRGRFLVRATPVGRVRV
jgi:hypothetical protein